MQIQFWPFKAVPVCLLPTPQWGFRRLLPWRQSHTSICPRLPLVWPEISSESITHLRLAGHVSHGKSAVSHILRGIVVEYWVCVCVCVYLYSTDYLIGVSWKSCGITHLCNVRTSVCQSGPRTPAANIIFTRLSEMVQVWITISLPSPVRPPVIQK